MQGRFKREGSAGEDAELNGTEVSGASGGTAVSSETGDELDEAPATAPRVTREGSRLRLRNWRISTRLVSLIALPVLAATVFGALRIQDSLDDIERLDTMQLLTEMTDDATSLASRLQEERDRSAGPLISGASQDSDEVARPRDLTDAAIDNFKEASLAIDDDDKRLRGVYASVLDITQQLNDIADIRQEAYEDPNYVSQTVFRYNQLIGSLLSLSSDMAQATGNSYMIQYTRALAEFSEAKESASIQRAIITAGLARAERDDASVGLSDADWRYGRTHHLQEDSALDSFLSIFPDPEEAARLVAPISSESVLDITAANQYAQRVFASLEGMENEPRPFRQYFDESRAEIDQMDNIEQTLLTGMRDEADRLRGEAMRDALLNGLVTALVLGISLLGAWFVARSMVRSLRRLQDTAQEVAHKRLPEVVKQMSEADPQDVDTSVEPIGVYSRDEIGRVAQAFDEVHREAVRLAGEQALLRGNVNAMFTNLSRRSQGLIQRQLSLISELESREADPDQLSSLFKLDHLATRMRRNGENLLVLAGEEPGRRWTRPVPLVDVLRAAASEVEQYERIELSAVPKTDVAGRVVNDLVHLLAELLENATSFSSPQTKVKVTGHALPDGRILVEIHDNGIGLSPEDLAEINDRLANPPTVDVSVSRRMGLFVVGRLSLRHGIRIQLRPSDSGGTTALVMLPADVAQGGARGGRSSGETPKGGSSAAALLRDAPSIRRPPAGTPAAAGAGDVGGEGTVRLPGRSRGSLSSLNRASATRSQVSSGGRDRPALPSRTAPSGLGGPGVPPTPPVPSGVGGPRPAADRDEPDRQDQAAVPEGRSDAEAADQTAETPVAGTADSPADAPTPPAQAGPRPSWASRDAGDSDRPRGHDEAASGEDEAAHPAESPAVSAQPAQPVPDAGDELTGPLPAVERERATERTPIFEEMESTWFGTRRAVVPPPGDPAGAPQTASASAAAPAAGPGAPAGEAGGQAPPSHGTSATTQSPSSSQAGEPTPRQPVPPPRPDQPASAVPPTAEAQAGGQRPAGTDAGTGRGGASAPWRPSPNDERWRQAEQVRQPTAGGVTTSGLPRRVPRANLVPGAAESQESAQPGPTVSRSPEAVRGRLTNLRRGIQQGRRAGSSAGRTDGDFGPRYQ